MATRRQNEGFNTDREPESIPTILTGVLCSQVDIFLKRAVQHHTDIRKYQGTDVARFVNNVKISWETEQHNIDTLWKKYYPDRYSIQDEPAHHFTPLRPIENNPKIIEFNRASSTNFQKEWVHLIDLVVQCLKRLNNAMDHWCNMFIGKWTACREHVYSLWQEALAKETAQNTLNVSLHHLRVQSSTSSRSANDQIDAFFEEYKHLSSTGQGQRTLNKASKQEFVSEDYVQVQDTRHNSKRTDATSSKSTPSQDAATTPIPITKVDFGSKQQENLTSKYINNQDRDIGACSPEQFSTRVITRPPAIIEGPTQHQQQQAPDINYEENDNRHTLEENERLKREKEDLRNKCDKYKEAAWAWEHGNAENENRVEVLEEKNTELRESATHNDNRSQHTIWEKAEEISRLNEQAIRLTEELKATQDENLRLKDKAVPVNRAKEQKKGNSAGTDCVAQEWKDKYYKMRREFDEYKQLKTGDTDKVNSLRTTIKQKDEEIFRLKEQVTTSRRDVKAKKMAMQSLEKEVSSMKHTMQQQQVEKATLMDQLSASMNREMSRDETDLENINVRNRPMKIMEEFELFCSQQWLNAKTALDENAERTRADRPLDESVRCALLCNVIWKSYEWAEDLNKKLQNKVMQRVARYATDPVSLVIPDNQASASAIKASVSDTDFQIALSKVLKKESHNADFRRLSQSILHEVFKDQISRCELDQSLLQSRELAHYATTALSLCWRMCLQQPPLTLDCHSLLGECKIGDKAEPHYGSANPGDPTSMVQYYVYPAVLHGRTQMKKARVFLVSTSGPS